MSPYEIFALDWHLSEYPADKPFDEVLEMVSQEHEEIRHLEDYQDFWGEHLATMIENLAVALERNYLYIKD